MTLNLRVASVNAPQITVTPYTAGTEEQKDEPKEFLDWRIAIHPLSTLRQLPAGWKMKLREGKPFDIPSDEDEWSAFVAVVAGY